VSIREGLPKTIAYFQELMGVEQRQLWTVEV